MLRRSLLTRNCNTFVYQIRYGSNLSKDKKSTELNKFIESTRSKIEKTFPRIYNIYSLIYKGFQGIWADSRKFLTLAKKVTSSEGLDGLDVADLEFFNQSTRNTKKILPVIFLAILPLGNFLIIPLAYYFPKRCLTPHFWTEAQKEQFAIEEFKDRSQFYNTILQELHEHPNKGIPDDIVMDWRSCLRSIEKGKKVSVSELMQYTSLFDGSGVYSLHHLSNVHVLQLLNFYNMFPLIFQRKALRDYAGFHLLLDTKIRESGGPKNLSDDLLNRICIMRSMNPLGMKKDEQIQFLEDWLLLNQKTSYTSYSLLLHTPILLGYNYPCNRSEINKGE